MKNIEILEKLMASKMPDFKLQKPTTTFEDMGMDSYCVVDFIMCVEEEFGIAFDDQTILNMKSLADVLNVIEAHN